MNLKFYQKAKNLAIKLGVNISTSAGTQEIIEKLSAVINSQKQKAKDINNYEAELGELQKITTHQKENRNSF